MRPLPRILAVTDDEIVGQADFPIRAAAIASAGPAIGLVVRSPAASGGQRLRSLERVRALARPAEAATIAHGDPALGRIAGAQGVQLRTSDLSPADARRVLRDGWIGVSIHHVDEGREARDGGADYLVAGSVYRTASHPDRPARGLDWLVQIVALGLPVFAIGGITADRLADVKATGAYGAAAIGALWREPDPAKAADLMVREWSRE